MAAVESLELDDKVRHPKFGQGTVVKRFGEGERQKVIVRFGAETGERKLAVKHAKMKKINERPVLVGGEEGDGTAGPAAAEE